LHVFDRIRWQLDDNLLLVTGLNFFFKDIKNFALYVFCDFLLVIASLLKPIVELRVLAPKEYDKLEPSLWEEIA
jgi:hypothetical protein